MYKHTHTFSDEGGISIFSPKNSKIYSFPPSTESLYNFIYGELSKRGRQKWREEEE
jgi:hypothetical protein